MGLVEMSFADKTMKDIPLEEVEAAFKNAATSHPRLFYTKAQEPEIKRKIDANPQLQTLYEAILKKADAVLDQPPVERIKTGRRLLSVSRECLSRVMLLGTSYRFTRQPKYLARAEKEMLAAAAFSDWNPSHFLDVGEMTAALAIGYDWMYPELSEQTRTTIREAIFAKGIEPSLEKNAQNWWLRSANNWNQVCNGGITLGALAIMEDHPALARQLVHRAVNTVQTAMAEYEPDGAYPEGPGYWVYGTTYNVVLIAALESVLGTDFGLSQKTGFARSAEYYLHMTGPGGLYFNYPDSGSRGSLVPTVFWFAGHYKNPSVAWWQERMIEDARARDTSSLASHRLIGLALPWATGRAETPKHLAWMGRGSNPVAAFRSSWTDPDAVYLAIKGGSPATNHAHMDIGSFVIDADGIRWAVDLGPENYNKIESLGMNLWARGQESDRWKIFRYANFSHNTLVVDGQLQRVKGMAPIIRYSSDRTFPHTVIDMTTVYQGQLASALRGAVLLPTGQILIQDEMTATGSPATIRWAMATKANVDIQSDQQALLTQDGKTLHLEIIGANNAKLATYSTEPRADYDAPNPNTRMIGFQVELDPKEKIRMAVLITSGSTDVRATPPSLRSLTAWSAPLE